MSKDEPVSLELKNTIVTAILFQYTCKYISSEIKPYPSTTINSCYQKVFNTKTEYSDDSQCVIEIYLDSNKVQQYIGLMSDNVWKNLFDNWYKQHSTIVQFSFVLTKIYPENYKFQNKELRIWHAMFQTCGCSDITPFLHMKFQIEF
ncbi:4027_t:CDS:2 [Diversispora eburnea]|uniref:4027_t:CDS:1 n=1 Tax=Diversispora eburnea TaxID=1213867 RepID=A0A9N9BRM9_9GLOM|nr:4027_t:CDS:2 [Diversispora eburnea]